MIEKIEKLGYTCRVDDSEDAEDIAEERAALPNTTAQTVPGRKGKLGAPAASIPLQANPGEPAFRPETHLAGSRKPASLTSRSQYPPSQADSDGTTAPSDEIPAEPAIHTFNCYALAFHTASVESRYSN